MRATINGVDLAYTDQGTGLPVVLLHAFPLSRAMWSPQIKELAQHVRVIALDFRGHGESAPVRGPFTLDDLAADVVALLDHLALPNAVCVGLSMGGYVLFRLYQRAAARVKALVLADTRAQADSPEGREGRFSMIQMAETQGAGAIADAMLPKLLSPASRETRPDLVADLRRIMTGNAVSTITADLRAMADRPDSTAMLTTMAAPTLVMVGALDQGTPPSDATMMADRIPNARLVIIPEAGHLSNLEQPDRFNAALVEFLTGLR